MGIQITNSVVQPQISYNKVFLQHLSIDQTLVTADALTPLYKVFVEYRLYGVYEGIRYYAPDTREVELQDFVTEAILLASRGNPVLLQSLGAIEAAIAVLIATDLDTKAEVV